MVDTIKFSQMTDGGDLANGEKTPGLLGGENVLFNNPWTFLPSGTTADRPAPSSLINYRLRFNTDLQEYEFYDAVLGIWTQLQDSGFTAGPFVIYEADPAIPDGQNLGALANGILKQTITADSATLDIAVNGVDYYGPGYTGYLVAPAGIADIDGNFILTTTSVGASAVNSLRVVNSITGNPVLIESIGFDTNVGLSLITKGTGQLRLESGNATQPLIIVSGTSGNHFTRFAMADTSADRTATWQDSDGTIAWLSDVAGTVTSAQGTEFQVLVNGNFGTQETGACIFTTPQDIAPTSLPTFDSLTLTTGIILDPNANNAIQFTYVASAVNYLRTYNSATGDPVLITAQGLDADVGITMSSLGNGNLNFVPSGTGKVCLLQADGLPGSSASFQMVKNGQSSGFLIGSFINDSSAGGTIYYKTRGTTVSSFTAVQNNDDLGTQQYYGADGTDDNLAAIVYARVDGSVSTGIVPGKFQWYTTNSSGVSTLGMTLNAAQQLVLANALAVPYGGTGLTSATAYALLAGGTTSTGAFQSLGTGTAGQLLQSNGGAALPSWTTATFPSGSGTLNHMLRSDGTNWVETTAMTVDSSDNLSGLATVSSSGSVSSTGGSVISGATTGGFAGKFIAYSPTSTLGSIALVAVDNAGNFSNQFTHASTAAARTWTLPDASGTIALTSDLTGYVTAVNGTANRITSSGGTTPTIDISASYVGQSSITTLGTIGTGVWQGTVVGSTYGGTGVNNGASTITLGGSLSTIGAFTAAFTMTGNTSVTFPTSGTLATTSQLPSLGNYTFSANTMTVASGNMLFTPPGGVLTLQNNLGGSDPSFNISSTSATGQPFLQWSRNSTTAIGYIQCGTNSTGAGTGDNMLFLNPLVGGSYYFNVATVGQILALNPTNITTPLPLISTLGSISSGSSAGGVAGSFTAFSTTTNLGSLSLTAANNAGNFANILTNASTSAARTWTLPDETGTLAIPINGTFTPTFTFATPGDQSIAYAIQNGSYTQIGRVVYFSYSVRFTPTYTTASGNALFGGLPVAIDNTVFYQIPANSSQGNAIWPAGVTQLYFTTSSTSAFLLAGDGSATVQTNFSVTQFPTGVEQTISATGFYFV